MQASIKLNGKDKFKDVLTKEVKDSEKYNNLYR